MESRNHVPWIIIGFCVVANMFLLYIIRVLLSRENQRRDSEPPDDTYDNVFVTKIDQDGNRVEMKVSKVCGSFIFTIVSLVLIRISKKEFLDLTDKQNRDFRYVL